MKPAVLEGLPLFARRDDPDTSRRAAASMVAPAGSQRWEVLEALRRRPMTADEIDVEIGWRDTTAGRRLRELERHELVEPTGDTRTTRSGREARVYRVTAKARQVSSTLS